MTKAATTNKVASDGWNLVKKTYDSKAVALPWQVQPDQARATCIQLKF